MTFRHIVFTSIHWYKARQHNTCCCVIVILGALHFALHQHKVYSFLLTVVNNIYRDFSICISFLGGLFAFIWYTAKDRKKDRIPSARDTYYKSFWPKHTATILCRKHDTKTSLVYGLMTDKKSNYWMAFHRSEASRQHQSALTCSSLAVHLLLGCPNYSPGANCGPWSILNGP